MQNHDETKVDETETNNINKTNKIAKLVALLVIKVWLSKTLKNWWDEEMAISVTFNCLLYGITITLCRRLQSLQNAATGLVTGTRRRDHIAPVLRDLHWLPVRRCVDCKLALLVYKSLHGLTPSYLSDDYKLVSSDKFRRRLRSANVDTCIAPRTETRLGDRSFSAAGPWLWNSLPSDLRRPDTELGEFRRLLKTYLFGFS